MNYVTTTINQLKLYGEEMMEHRVVRKVLITLTKRFESVVTTIEEAKYLIHLSVDELMGSLLSHESKIIRNEKSSLEKQFQTQASISVGRG